MHAHLIRIRALRLAAPAVTVAGLIAAITIWAHPGRASGQSADIRPICNNLFFNIPTSVGQRVLIPTHAFAADPDVTPIKLVSIFGGTNLGKPTISGNDILFTRTSTNTGTTTIFWTISDGTLTAQCTASGTNAPPPPGG
jgi:hypothetical protein